jgi:fatty-acyl-CoA synthase
MDSDELKEFCHGKIAHYKIPRFTLFKSRDFLPETSSGKIKKNVLSQKCYAELCEQQQEECVAVKA